MADYSGVTARAKSLIARKGGDVVFTSKTGVVKDPVTQGVTASGKPATYPFKAVSVGVGNSWTRRGNTLTGVRSDAIMFVPEGYEPTNGDDVLWSGAHWTVTDLQDVSPDGEAIVLTVLITR